MSSTGTTARYPRTPSRYLLVIYSFHSTPLDNVGVISLLCHLLHPLGCQSFQTVQVLPPDEDGILLDPQRHLRNSLCQEGAVQSQPGNLWQYLWSAPFSFCQIDYFRNGESPSADESSSSRAQYPGGDGQLRGRPGLFRRAHLRCISSLRTSLAQSSVFLQTVTSPASKNTGKNVYIQIIIKRAITVVRWCEATAYGWRPRCRG